MGKVRNFLKKRYLNFTVFKWCVGIAEFDRDVVLSGNGSLKIHWLKGENDRSWFADPFILSANDTVVEVLVEELFYENNKGRISRLTVDLSTWRIVKITPVIDLRTHLSFPAYFRKDGKVFIYPESSKSGKLTLYEYDEQSGSVTVVRDLCELPLADAAIFDLCGRPAMLATTFPFDNGNMLDVYRLDDNFVADRVQSVEFDTCVARNAGLPFKIDGQWYRPAQDCTESYGKCVVIQKMDYDGGSLNLSEIRRFKSYHSTYREAFHTFNVFEDRYVAVDAEGFRYGLPALVVSRVRNIFRRKERSGTC